MAEDRSTSATIEGKRHIEPSDASDKALDPPHASAPIELEDLKSVSLDQKPNNGGNEVASDASTARDGTESAVTQPPGERTPDDASKDDQQTASEAVKLSDGDARSSDDAGTKDDRKTATEVVKEGNSKEKTEDATDDSKYPSGTKLALLTFGLAMATFVIGNRYLTATCL